MHCVLKLLQIRDNLQKALEQRVESALNERSEWLQTTSERVEGCSGTSGSVYDVEQKLATLTELQISMHSDSEFGDHTAKKLEYFKDSLNQRALERFKTMNKKNEEKTKALSRDLENLRYVKV
jgi:predicted metal-dependent hydrolase